MIPKIETILLGIIIIRSFTQAVHEEKIDCQAQHVDYGSQEIQKCCREPSPNLKVFPKECTKFTSFNMPSNQCAFECVFNKTKSLEKGVLKIANLRPILTQLYNDSIFIEVYERSFAKCVPIVNNHFAKLKASGRSIRTRAYKGQNCSSIGLMYALCSHTQFFINCPKSMWSPSSLCEHAKNYAKSCELFAKSH